MAEEKKYLDRGGLERTWSKIKTYMGNNYAAKSHMHTASQITDFATQVDSRINSKVGDAAIIDYSNQSKSGTDGSTAVGNSSRSISVSLDSIAINNIACIKLTASIIFEVYGMSPIESTEIDITYNINVKFPSGGTYLYNNTFYSGGSAIKTFSKTERLKGNSNGTSYTKSFTSIFEIIRVA